jgi:murein DD-endopeptidase MepM/ murein hydrolase activator NlpD
MRVNPPGARRLLAGWLALLLLTLCQPLLAEPQEPQQWQNLAGAQFQGHWRQGEILRGRVAPGSKVEIMGEQPVILPDGRFILGLDRDAPGLIEIRVTAPTGQSQRVQQKVQQRDYNLQRVNGVEDKYVNPDPAVTARINRDNQLTQAARARRDARDSALAAFAWPLAGPISGVFGSQRVFNGMPRRPHYGLDIAAPVGAPVRAPQAGLVTLAEPDLYFSGGTLIIDHGLGLTSTCMHLSRLLVKTGQWVQQGDLIAEVGATGRVTGPHLDWRMNWHNQRVDPHPLVAHLPMPH